MHIPKLLTMISVVTLGAGSLSVQAQRPDTDLQAEAREQMRKAMLQLETQSPTNAMPAPEKPKPVKKIVVQPPPQPTPPPVMVVPAAPKPVVPPPAAVPPPMQVRTVPPPAVVSIPEEPKPVVVAKKKAAPIKETGFSPYSPIAEPANTQNPPVTLVIPGESPVMAPGNTLKRTDEKKAREEVRKSLAETAPPKKPEPKFPAEAKMPPQNTATPMASPRPTPAPGSKEERLSELLDLYKADKISPAEYHDQRAKILAEP